MRPTNKETIINGIWDSPYSNGTTNPTKPRTAPIIIGNKNNIDFLKFLKIPVTASSNLSYIFIKTAIVPPEKPGIIIDTPIAIPLTQFDKKFLILFVFMYSPSFIYYKWINKIIKEKVKKEKVKKEKVKKEKAPKPKKAFGRKKKDAEDEEPLTIVSLADLRQKKDEE